MSRIEYLNGVPGYFIAGGDGDFHAFTNGEWEEIQREERRRKKARQEADRVRLLEEKNEELEQQVAKLTENTLVKELQGEIKKLKFELEKSDKKYQELLYGFVSKRKRAIWLLIRDDDGFVLTEDQEKQVARKIATS